MSWSIPHVCTSQSMPTFPGPLLSVSVPSHYTSLLGASIMQLPTEIYVEIANIIGKLSVLHTFTLSCHAVQHACQPVLWERLNVTECCNSGLCVLWFKKNSHLTQHTRIVTFLGPGDNDLCQAHIWYNFDLLMQLISQGRKL